jgi:micrococcal nuclease
VSRSHRAAAALLALAGCRTAAPAPVVPLPPPAPHAAASRGDARPAAAARLLLDGRQTAVRWTDGDTFGALDGPFADRRFRLEGVNALESYGPVHRWGGWRPGELLELARRAARLVRSRPWSCRTLPGGGGYGRELASCPDAAQALVDAGLAMVFAVGGPPDAALVAAQRAAQARGAGMWARGVPPWIPSSIHAAGEPDLEDGPYDRLVDTRTGRTEVRHHQGAYATCQEVCYGSGPETACMVYVPFERRYRNRPGCLLGR